VSVEKTKYMSIFRHQNTGQLRSIKIDNKCFESVANIEYFGATRTN
jgi:hypothetical protein